MAEIYVLNTLDNKRASKEGFASKKAAKQLRDKLNKDGVRCVVSRGPDHPHGPTQVESSCQNSERTSRRRNKRWMTAGSIGDTMEQLHQSDYRRKKV